MSDLDRMIQEYNREISDYNADRKGCMTKEVAHATYETLRKMYHKSNILRMPVPPKDYSQDKFALGLGEDICE